METRKQLKKESRESKANKLIKKFKKKCKKCKKFEFLGTPCSKHKIEIIDTIAREEGYQQAKKDVLKLGDDGLIDEIRRAPTFKIAKKIFKSKIQENGTKAR